MRVNQINFINFCAKNDGKIDNTARKTNAYIVNSLKNPTQDNFFKATQSDYEILTAKDYCAPLRRAKWFNPKDGRVYWLIKNGKNPDKTWNVRILDEFGGFIKNASIKNKFIFITDNFEIPKRKHFEVFDLLEHKASHGEIVKRFAQVTNPFATYDVYDVATKNRSYNNVVAEDNETVYMDSVNFSWGHDIQNKWFDALNKKTFDGINNAVSSLDFKNMNDDDTADFAEIQDTLFKTLAIEATQEMGVDFFVSSGNYGKDYFNFLLLKEGVNGVGSLNPKGKISNFSSSRNSELTQHYELGEFTPKLVEGGINYTGGDWLDKPIDFQKIFPLHGRPALDFLVDPDELENSLEIEDSKEWAEKYFKKWQKENKVIPGEYLCFYDEYGDYNPFPAEEVEEEMLFYSAKGLIPYTLDKDGMLVGYMPNLTGTSLSSPVRAARYALNDAMEGIIE